MDYVIAALLVVVIGLVVVAWKKLNDKMDKRNGKIAEIYNELDHASRTFHMTHDAVSAAIQSLRDELLSERGGGKDIATQLYKPGALVEVLGHLHNLHNNLFWSRASVGTSEEEINRPNGTLVEIKTAMNRMNQNVLDIPIRLASLRSKPKPAPRKARKGVKK
jgi:hypothetical protein